MKYSKKLPEPTHELEDGDDDDDDKETDLIAELNK
jgi:hypothetical protein